MPREGTVKKSSMFSYFNVPLSTEVWVWVISILVCTYEITLFK